MRFISLLIWKEEGTHHSDLEATTFFSELVKCFDGAPELGGGACLNNFPPSRPVLFAHCLHFPADHLKAWKVTIIAPNDKVPWC